MSDAEIVLRLREITTLYGSGHLASGEIVTVDAAADLIERLTRAVREAIESVERHRDDMDSEISRQVLNAGNADPFRVALEERDTADRLDLWLKQAKEITDG
jgi:hypothetical protein